LFAVSLVTAGLIINTLVLNVGVAEPFTVQYAVLGDGGDYNLVDDGACSDNGVIWFSAGDTSIPGGTMLPMETRKFCVKIDNVGESAIDYEVVSSVLLGNDNYVECAYAFPETSISGSAAGSTTTITGQEFTVPGDAEVVTGCEMQITVARG